MFKLKYNILVGIQVLLTTINAALTMRIFGVGMESDAYLLSGSIIATLMMLQGLFISQFMHFYNDLKIKSIEDAHNFYNATFLISIILGVVLFLIYYLSLDLIIPIFASNIDISRYVLLKNLLSISTLIILATPVVSINQIIFNAEMKFSIPYILAIVPVLFSVLTQFYLLWMGSKDIKLLVLIQSLTTFLSAIIGSVIIAKTLIPFKFKIWHPMIKGFVKNSFTMQIGHGLYGFLQPIIINNFLVMFPQGFVSYYYYARKIIDIVNNVTIGPSRNILQSKLSQEVAKRNIKCIKLFNKNYIKITSLICLIMIPIVFFIQSPILSFISANNLTEFDLNNIKWLYLLMVIPTFLGIFFCGAILILTAAKKSLDIMLINISYVIFLYIFVKILTPSLQFNALPCATILTILSNMIIYKIREKQVLTQLSQGR